MTMKSERSSRWMTGFRTAVSHGIFSRGAISFLLATAGVNVFNFLFHVVVSRLLGPAHYSALGALLSIVSLLSVPLGAAQLAVTQAVARRVDADVPIGLGRSVGLAAVYGLIAMGIIIAFTSLIDRFLHLGSWVPVMLVAGWIPVAAIGAVLTGALIGEYRFRAVAIATFVGGAVVRLAVGVFLAETGGGVAGAISATIFAQVVTTGILGVLARSYLGRAEGLVSLRATSRDTLLSIGALTGLTALMGVDTVLARHYFTPSVAGQYSAGAVAARIALFVPSAITTVAFPHMIAGDGTSMASRRAFVQTLGVVALIGALVAVALTTFGSLTVRILFGSAYGGSKVVLGTLAFESAALGVLSVLVYFHLARRSWTALGTWIGLVVAAVLVTFDHQSPSVVASISLLVVIALVVVMAAPAARSVIASGYQVSTGSFATGDFSYADLDFTLVIPFRSPGERFGTNIENVLTVLSESGITYEVLAVSDGPTDGSEKQLEGMDTDTLTLIRLSKKSDKGAALRVGLARGRGRYIGVIDGDGDIPDVILRGYLERIAVDDPDIIYGSKRHRGSQVVYPPLRLVYSWFYQQINQWLFRLPVRDTQTGVKAIRRDVLVGVLPRMVGKGFAFDLELFVIAKRQGFNKFVEMPVEINERFTSTVSLRLVEKTMFDTLAIFYRLRLMHYYDGGVSSNSVRGAGAELVVGEESIHRNRANFVGQPGVLSASQSVDGVDTPAHDPK